MSTQVAALVPQDDDFQILDVYGKPSAPPEERVPWLATISAGTLVQGDKGARPAVSRDGTIHLHDPEGRAPKLAEALVHGSGKRLTVAVANDRLSEIIQQEYRRYSASSLEVYGDARSLTELRKNAPRVTYPVGTAEYEALRSTCKVNWSLFFVLARWDGAEPKMMFPDGLGLYRLRSTSRNGLREIVAGLTHIARLTGGRLAGIPLDLAIVQRDVAGPDGLRRNVPIWTVTLRPPETMELTAGNFQALVGRALDQGAALRALPAPRALSVDDALATLGEEPTDLETGEYREVTDTDVQRAVAGDPPCDAEHWRAMFFASVRGTAYDNDVARARLLEEYTDGAYASLAVYLANATEREASGLLAYVDEQLSTGKQAARTERLAPALDGRPAPPQPSGVIASDGARLVDAATGEVLAGGGAVRMCTAQQLDVIKRLAPTSATRDVDWATLTYDQAGTWIESLQPPRAGRPS